MKILYGIQATGNGHISRAIELIPKLQEIGIVDTLISGTQGHLDLPFNMNYIKRGFSFYGNRKGSIDYIHTIKNFKPRRLINDIKKCPADAYDLVISDFEPITAWASKKSKTKCIALSHQAAFKYLETPRPAKKSTLGELILKNYSPGDEHIGIHFQAYNDNIYEPIIRSEIRNLKTEISDFNLIYLPAYDPQYIANILFNMKEEKWKIFSAKVNEYKKIKNVEIHPISHKLWIESLRCAKSIIMGAGFDGPAESIYLGKKLMVVPMKKQYEQLCNAVALNKMNIPSIDHFGIHQLIKIRKWMADPKAVQINYRNSSEFIIDRIVNLA